MVQYTVLYMVLIHLIHGIYTQPSRQDELFQ